MQATRVINMIDVRAKFQLNWPRSGQIMLLKPPTPISGISGLKKTALQLDFADLLDVLRKRFKQMKDVIYEFTVSSQQKLDVNRSF